MTRKRVTGEIFEITCHGGADKTITVVPVELSHGDGDTILRGLILAPEGSPMENYVLSLSIKLPPEYPFKPPKIEFENKVWHPRVNYELGSLCMPKLSPEKWDPKLHLEPCLASIQHMLIDPFMDPTSMGLAKNRIACEQYYKNRNQYSRVSRAVTADSNEGYGKISFHDHRIASIQKVISTLPNEIKYTCSIFCERKSIFTWHLLLFIIPAVDIYQYYTAQHTQQFPLRLTSFDFRFKANELRVGIPEMGVSKDKCWAIRRVSTLVIKKEQCDADPRKLKDHPPMCELSLKWIRPEIVPQRFAEKITLTGPLSERLYSVDVTLDPSSFDSLTRGAVNIQVCFRKLLPMASMWENIGCLLGISAGKLKEIKHDEKSADNCLREMLNTWLESTTQRPTWATLAEAVQPFNESIAEELRHCDIKLNS